MKAKIKNLTDEIVAALAPVFAKHPDYDDIFNAMTLVMARVIQATPDKGNERRLQEVSTMMIGDALRQFLALEEQYEAEQAAKKKAKAEIVAKGIDGFADLEPIGGHILSDKPFALQGPAPVIEPGSAADYPDNPNQNLAKTVAPFSPEIQQAMVEEDRAYEELTKLPEGTQIPKGLVNTGPKHNDPHGIFVEPPIHIQEEAEQAKQDTYKEAP